MRKPALAASPAAAQNVARNNGPHAEEFFARPNPCRSWPGRDFARHRRVVDKFGRSSP